MKKGIKTICFALALLAGAFCLQANAFFSILPKNVQVNGVNVGGMKRSEAAKAVREEIQRNMGSLTVNTPAGEVVFTYPEIDFISNEEEILRRAKKNGRYFCRVEYYLKGEEEVLSALCEENSRAPQNAFVTFNGSFSYAFEKDGVGCEKGELLRAVERSLEGKGERKGDFEKVTLKTFPLKPEKTVEGLKKETLPVSYFSTSFSLSNAPRAHNIARAAQSVNGTILMPGEEFSFNRAVGARTKERGYEEANVILDGKFVLGVGGGVCQMSTTLYNAALLSGMKITAVSAHSRRVSYVEPSFDAMVSSVSDLRFVNPFLTPVYIRAGVKENKVEVEFFGKPSGYKYERKSEVLSKEGEESLISRGSVLIYKDGILQERTRIREDNYLLS